MRRLLQIYDEPEPPNMGACFTFVVESSNEGACLSLSYLMNRYRQIESGCLRYMMNRYVGRV